MRREEVSRTTRPHYDVAAPGALQVKVDPRGGGHRIEVQLGLPASLPVLIPLSPRRPPLLHQTGQHRAPPPPPGSGGGLRPARRRGGFGGQGRVRGGQGEDWGGGLGEGPGWGRVEAQGFGVGAGGRAVDLQHGEPLFLLFLLLLPLVVPDERDTDNS